MRGAALLGSSLFFISGLRFLPIAEASATGFVAPLFVTALSIVFLGEKVGLRRWIATAVGLIGVLIILRPGTGAFHPAAFFPLVSALAWACTLIMTRMMSGTERAITTMTYSSIAGLLILSALVPFVWVTPTWHDIAFGIFIGVASTAGQWIVVLAFRYADASVLAPFSYTQLLWVSVLGFLVFGEVPDVYTITGAAFIVASGALHRPSRAGPALAAAGCRGRVVAERLILPCAGRVRGVTLGPSKTWRERHSCGGKRPFLLPNQWISVATVILRGTRASLKSGRRRRAPGNGVRALHFQSLRPAQSRRRRTFWLRGRSPCRRFSSAWPVRRRPQMRQCAPDPASSGQTVTCSGNTLTGFQAGGGVNNLTVNVLPGATVSDGGGGVIIGVNDFNTVTNSGTLAAGPTAPASSPA